jgi:uncharacterized membrane protein YbjE (DUF340 family)
MGDHLITAVVTIITAIIGVAIIATIVSPKANTAAVITAGGNATGSLLQTALSPVTGASNILGSTPAGFTASF